MAGDQPFLKQVGVHVTAGIVLFILAAWWGWASGWLRALWDWMLTAVPAFGDAIWAMLVYRASIPVWVLLLTAVVLVFIFRRVLAAASAQETIATPVKTLRGLGELELQILRMLALADGRSFPFDELAINLRTPKLLLDQSVDILMSRDLIRTHQGSYGFPEIGLTAAGRDFVIQQGFVGVS